MASATRRRIPLVIRDVLENSHKYPIHQALRLLEEGWFGDDSITTEDSGKVRMRAAPEVSFPGADIKRTHVDTQGNVEFEVNFMGLYGVDSPLPTFIPALAVQDNERAQRLRQFLDIVNQRIYTLYYLVWKKYHAYVQLGGKTNRYLNYLQALSGGVITTEDDREFAYAGLFGDRAHNAVSLSYMLQEYLDGTPVNVTSFQPQLIRIPNMNRINGGNNLCLGDNIVIGEQLLDVTNKIGIHIGPIDNSAAMQLLPTETKAKRLGNLIRRYVKATMKFDLIIKVNPEPEQQCQLGQDNLCLGWSSWTGQQLNKVYDITMSNEHLLSASDNSVGTVAHVAANQLNKVTADVMEVA